MSAGAWASVTAARRSLPEFLLPEAGRLQGHLMPVSQVPAPDWAALHTLLHSAGDDRAARSRMITRVNDALAPWPMKAIEPAPGVDRLVAPQTHDDYFRIGRAGADAAVGYLGGIGRALTLFLDEVHDSGELPDYAVIAEALLSLWQQAWPAPGEPGAAGFCALAALATARDGAAAPLHQRAADPLQRWLRGHQVFAVLTQGMVWSLDHLPHALATGDDERAEQVLLALAALYRASAAAFRFTADFDAGIYAGTIRPTMCEPYMPKGFSGTLSSDHGELVARLTHLREPLLRAQQRWPAAYALMRQALGEVYDNHRWVCERFDGAKVPSLRTSSVCGQTSAVEMLDRFRAHRLDMLR